MSDSRKVWFLPGNDDQPSGPFSEAEVLQKLLRGEISHSTLCWREGMEDWQPLGEVPAFAARKQKKEDSIRFTCSCGALIEVPAAYRGRPVQCPSCEMVQHAPGTGPAAPPGGGSEVEERPTKEAESSSKRSQTQGTTLPRKPAGLSFVVGFVLVIVAAAALGVAASQPWMDIPQSPLAADSGEGATGVGNIAADFKADNPLLDRSTLIAFPLVTLLLGLLGSFMPRAWLRGSLLLIVFSAAAIVWFIAVKSIDNYLLLWTPLARYVESPAAFNEWRPGQPQLGLALWITAGGLLSLFFAAAVNLCRSPAGGVVTVLVAAAIGIVGYSHWNDWYRPAGPDVSVSVEVSQPTGDAEAASLPKPEVAALVSLVNLYHRPVVLVPAWGPGEAGPQTATGRASAAPGQWISDWGEPDLAILIEPGDDSPVHSARQPQGPLPVTFVGRSSHGCVIPPGGQAQASFMFSPTWEPRRWRRDTRAGSWTISLRDGMMEVRSETFKIPGRRHPDDTRIAHLYNDLDIARKEAGLAVERIRSVTRRFESKNEVGSRTDIEGLIANIDQAASSIRRCHGIIDELARFGLQPSQEARTDLIKLEGLANIANLEMTGTFLSHLYRNEIAQATEKLSTLLDTEPGGSELGDSLQRLVPLFVADRAEALAKNPAFQQDVVILVLALEPVKANVKPDLRERIGTVLADVVRAHLYAGGSLVAPNGDLRLTKEWGAQLILALERAITWNPRVATREGFRESMVILEQTKEGDVQQAVLEFLESASSRAFQAEGWCWLGMKLLAEKDLIPAQRYFDNALRSSDERGEYTPLAQVGLAMIGLALSNDDTFLRACKERELYRRFEARRDWDLDIKRLTPETIIATRLHETDWVERLTIITRPEELREWLEGDQVTIPWLQLSLSQTLKPNFDKLRQLVDEGKTVWVSSRLIQRFSYGNDRLNVSTAPSAGGVAYLVNQWNQTPVDHPSFQGIQMVKYDTSPFNLLAKHTPSVERASQQGVLMTKTGWLVCVCRRHGDGRAIFLPAHVRDTHDGRKFLMALTEWYD